MRKVILILSIVIVCSALWAANQARNLYIDGKLVSTNLVMIKGAHYVAVDDLRNNLNMSVERQGDILILTSNKPATPSTSIQPTQSVQPAISIETQKQSRKTETMLKDAKEALQAMEAFDSVIKSGINRLDYNKRKADAQIVVDKFINEHGAENKFSQNLLESLACYDLARSLWDEYIKSNYSNNFIPTDNDLVILLLNGDTELKKLVTKITDKEYIYLDDGLNLYWCRAADLTAKSRQILKSYPNMNN
jgi:hypothetical protein